MKSRHSLFITFMTLLLLTAPPSAMAQSVTNTPDSPAAVDIAGLSATASKLAKAKLRQRAAIVSELEASGGEAALPLFSAMLAGDLRYRKADQRIVTTGEPVGDDEIVSVADAITGEALESASEGAFRKVRVNNSLRIQLRKTIARLTLMSSKPALREQAALNMLSKPDADNLPLLAEALAKEPDASIRESIELAMAVSTVKVSTDSTARLAALDTMSGNLNPAVRNELNRLIAVDDDGNPEEADKAVRDKAATTLDGIESRVSFFRFLETLFFGLSLGSVLMLAALGLAITFGVMGVINMAHGELIMLGAYTTFVVQLLMPNHIGLSILVAIPAAFVVSGLVGILIERGVIRFLHGRPLETLLATFGISLILQQAVRSIFSPLNRPVSTPEWMSGALELNPVLSLTYNRLYILVFALIVFFVLQMVLKKTSLGLNVRAVSQNRNMAKAIGIRSERVDALTFGLGSGIAGVAGVALSQLTNVGPNLGQTYIIDSFLVVVFGGAGNLWGTLVGGFTLGIANKFMEPVTGAVLANILVLIFIILFIQKRPRGLFPQKGRAADS